MASLTRISIFLTERTSPPSPTSPMTTVTNERGLFKKEEAIATITPRSSAGSEIQKYTHVIFTSVIEVELFIECADSHGYKLKDLLNIQFIALGGEVFRTVKAKNLPVICISRDAEYTYLLHWLALRSTEKLYLCISKFGFSIPPIRHAILSRNIRHQIYHLYDVTMHVPKVLIDLSEIEQIVFTSPLTVKVFFSLYNRIPAEKTLISIDSSTKEVLNRYL